MSRLARNAELVPGSGIREILDTVMRRGVDVLRLELGEPDFLAPAHVVDAAARAAAGGARYTQSAGELPLRKAFAARVSRLAGTDYAPAQIVATQGGVQGCALAFAALVSPGDEVLIPDPAWPNFEMQALLNGAKPVRYALRAEAGFLPDLAEVAALITDRTRVMVINSPSNPTGAVFPASLVRDLVHLAADRGVTVLSDEVYDELIFEGSPCNAVSYAPDNVVGVYSLSKTYAMTGWRVGYVASPSWLSPALTRLQEAQLSCVSQVSQAAALAAVTGPQDVVGVMRESYRQRRDAAMAICTDAGVDVVRPNGAFYLMFPFAAGVDGRDAALALIDEGIAVAPGTAFGQSARSFARLSLAVDLPVLTEALRRLTDWHRRTAGGLMPAAA
jgi:aspartate aminotransferase